MQYEFDDFILMRIARFLSPITLRQMRRTCKRIRALFDPRTFAPALIESEYPAVDMMVEAVVARDIPLCEHLFAIHDDYYYLENLAAAISASMVASDESYQRVCEWCASKTRNQSLFDVFARGCVEGCTYKGTRGGLECIGTYRKLLQSLELLPPLYDPFQHRCADFLVHAIRINNIALFRRCRKRVDWVAFQGDPLEYEVQLIELAVDRMSATNTIVVFRSLAKLAEQTLISSYSMDKRILVELKHTIIDRDEKHAFFAQYFGGTKAD